MLDALTLIGSAIALVVVCCWMVRQIDGAVSGFRK